MMAFSDILKIVPFSEVDDGNVFFDGIEFEGNTQSDFALFKRQENTGIELDTGYTYNFDDDDFVFVVKQTIDTELKFTLTVKITNAHQPVIDRIESLLLNGTSENSAEGEIVRHIIIQDNFDVNHTPGWNDYAWDVECDITPYPTEGATPENTAPRVRTHVHGTRHSTNNS